MCCAGACRQAAVNCPTTPPETTSTRWDPVDRKGARCLAGWRSIPCLIRGPRSRRALPRKHCLTQAFEMVFAIPFSPCPVRHRLKRDPSRLGNHSRSSLRVPSRSACKTPFRLPIDLTVSVPESTRFPRCPTIARASPAARDCARQVRQDVIVFSTEKKPVRGV